jgi:glycosyltransferase involved in cell wall biosynthesis
MRSSVGWMLRTRGGGDSVRIALVTDQYPPMVGGVPTVTQSLAVDLARRGHQVWAIVPSPDGHARQESADGVQVYRFASFGWPLNADQRMARVTFREMRRLVAAANPDVVHVHSPLALGWVGQRVARSLRKPVVATHHYLPAHVSPVLGAHPFFSHGLYSYFTAFYNRCTLVTAPSEAALHLLRKQELLVPARVVSNGVDLRTHAPGPPDPAVRRRLGVPEGRPLVLHVNRLAAEKRIDVLLEAFAHLRSDAQLVLAGAGPAEASLRTQVARLGLGNRVSLLGHLAGANLLALRRTAAVCAIASDTETQSLSTMEAMACGLPVVAANACALPELVRHGENGFLFEPGDSAALAACLDRVLGDEALRARMGARSLKAIAPHDRTGVLDRWEALYARLAAEAPSRSSYRLADPRALMAPHVSVQGI